MLRSFLLREPGNRGVPNGMHESIKDATCQKHLALSDTNGMRGGRNFRSHWNERLTDFDLPERNYFAVS